MRALLVLLVCSALLAPHASHCEFVFTLVPEHPIANEDVFVHVANTTGLHCFPPYSTVEMDGDSVVLKLSSTDACASEDYVSERDYRVGSFPPGSYSLDVEFCVYNPPPFPSGCSAIARFVLDVAEVGQPMPVPAHSKYALILLLLVILFVSGRRLNG